MINRRIFSSAALGAVLPVGAQIARPNGFPARPIKLVVPFPAGGTTDALARIVATRLSERVGQPVIVENKAGAGGLIGNDFVAKSPPDGYTLLLAITSLIQAPALYPSLPYEVPQSFAAISQISAVSDFLVVGNRIKATSLGEYLKQVKEEPGKHNFGSYGNATSSHIHGEMLNQQAKTDLVHTPYKGAPALITDIIGGQIEGGFVDVASLLPYLRAGKVKVLAVTGAERVKQAPDVPTFTELGFKYFEPYGFFGVLAPARTSGALIEFLGNNLSQIVAQADVTAKLEGMGLKPVGSLPAAFERVIRTDLPVWSKVIKDARITVD